MKKTLFVTIVLVVLCGCQGNNQSEVKSALKDALTVGQEIEQIERTKCGKAFADDCQTADKIKLWVDAGQKIYDANDISSNCDLMITVTDIAYQWVSENYPDKPYRVFIALLKSKLEVYCEEKP